MGSNSLQGISFFCDKTSKTRRIELSKLINALNGQWKISESLHTTNYVAVDTHHIVQGRESRIPKHFLKLADEIIL